jgi:hypothetical protein
MRTTQHRFMHDITGRRKLMPHSCLIRVPVVEPNVINHDILGSQHRRHAPQHSSRVPLRHRQHWPSARSQSHKHFCISAQCSPFSPDSGATALKDTVPSHPAIALKHCCPPILASTLSILSPKCAQCNNLTKQPSHPTVAAHRHVASSSAHATTIG